MESIAFVVRELTYLKLLQPIMQEISRMGCNFILYNMDSPKGEKEYNRPNKLRIETSFGKSIKLSPFSTDQQLLQLLKKDRITKMVSVEIGLWGNKFVPFFKGSGIKTYSILYLSDALWRGKSVIEGFDRVYYTTPHLMRLQHKFNGIRFDAKRDKCFGSPIFDQLDEVDNSTAESTLVFLPNQCDKKAFGSNERFCRIIKSFGEDLIFKSRKKQWIPEEAKKLAKEIVFDGEFMWPSAVSKLYPRTKTSILFYSSGIYEAVVAKQRVINIKFPLNEWQRYRGKERLEEYFGGGLYDWPGVVESVEQEDVLSGKIKQGRIDFEQRDKWIEKFVGKKQGKSYELIAQDILKE